MGVAIAALLRLSHVGEKARKAGADPRVGPQSNALSADFIGMGEAEAGAAHRARLGSCADYLRWRRSFPQDHPGCSVHPPLLPGAQVDSDGCLAQVDSDAWPGLFSRPRLFSPLPFSSAQVAVIAWPGMNGEVMSASVSCACWLHRLRRRGKCWGETGRVKTRAACCRKGCLLIQSG